MYRVASRVFAVAIVVILAVAETGAATRHLDLATYTDAAQFLGIDIGDSFPSRIAVCDFNGDGIDDIAVAAYEADGPGNSRPIGGEVYVVYGRRGAWTGPRSMSSADVTIYSAEANQNLGWDTECGDVNGDGLADLVLGAYWANSLNDSRKNAGQVHIIFGGPALPRVIDLAAGGGTVLWGAMAGDNAGQSLDVGDINGDGIDDIATAARRAPGAGGSPLNAGRVYIAFGRANWPASIDLMTGADVVLYGTQPNDYVGDGVMIGDLNGDGTAELCVAARSADGPEDSRASCGEIYVFRGRAVWPASMSISGASIDSWIYGPDANDQYGSERAMAVGDIDQDGRRALILGSMNASGPNNATFGTGEARLVEFGSGFTPSIDLGIAHESVMFGIPANLTYCSGVLADDISNDGHADLWCDAPLANGPGGTRSRAGEISVVYGRSGFPAVVDLSRGDADLVVYGAQIEDRIAERGTADIDADGVPDMLVSASTNSVIPRTGTLWIISPFDTDGDGVSNLLDNCPLFFNPDQADSVGDRRGDACRTDWDGDGAPDALDCAPSDPKAGKPPEIRGIVFQAGSKAMLTWQTQGLADTYDVSRGDLPRTMPADYGTCQNGRDPDLTDAIFNDSEVPLTGRGFFYVLRGHNARCGGAGPWGNTSAGQERVNSNPAGCP